MTSRYVLALLLTGLVQPSFADLPVCPVEPVDECPARDTFFAIWVHDQCQRLESLGDCPWLDAPQGDIPAWFVCGWMPLDDWICPNVNTCEWAALESMTTCEELQQFLAEVTCN